MSPNTTVYAAPTGFSKSSMPMHYCPSDRHEGREVLRRKSPARKFRRPARRAKVKLSDDRSKRNQICDQLQEMILSGERRPGSRLGQEELAQHFGVGQATIREALLELRRHGLVESIDRHGVFVTQIDRSKLVEVMEVREMDEALAVRRCCDRVTRVQIRQLTEMAETIHQLGLSEKFNEMNALDRQLHSKLIQYAGSSMLTRVVDYYRLLSLTAEIERDVAMVRDEHLAILNAIQDGRTDAAEMLVRQHIMAERVALDSGHFSNLTQKP